tara:strand:+ start:3659 stop:4912 length:1254 start_codon:yes stop_codon:yes gene_type:complete
MSFCIYGLGSTGESVIKYFKKKNFSDYVTWDDNMKKKGDQNFFSKNLDLVDYIILSPGINLKKAKLKKKLIQNKHKIITDLDLLYLFNPKIKSIVLTGTNGKSTTCKILEHVLKKNKINVRLGGNIGKPVLDLNLNNKPIVIIEASSFQLAYSKFVRPDYAAILNITNDHLDWHGSMNNYIKSKFKVFSLQSKKNFAFINDKKLIQKYKRNKYLGKLSSANSKNFIRIKKNIKNDYLNSLANNENLSFVHALSKTLKISDKSFLKSLRSFKGLPHRHEIFLKNKNKVFINDSKATTFEASKFALQNNKNIFWIVGGTPKLGDKFKLAKLKKNIFKSYVIGKYMVNFKNQLKGKVDFQLCGTLENAVNAVFKSIQKIKNEKLTILFSPAGSSYDQFKNFEERGTKFKKLIKSYAKKYA